MSDNSHTSPARPATAHSAPPRHPARLPRAEFLRAAQMYMLTAHTCDQGAVVYSFGTAAGGMIGITACPVDPVTPPPGSHPYEHITHLLRLTATIELWGFGLAYDGRVSAPTGPDATAQARAAADAGTLAGQPGARGMCASLLFDWTGDRYDLIRYHGTQQLTAIHTRAATNPYPPPGIHRYLWAAAVALNPAAPDRVTSPQTASSDDHDTPTTLGLSLADTATPTTDPDEKPASAADI